MTTSRHSNREAERVPSRPPGAPGASDKPERSSWWIGLLALVPIACCAGPALLAAGFTAGAGAAVGGVVGAALVVIGVTAALVALRRRRRRAAGRDTSC